MIEAVITCVNYADYLRHTLPNNIKHLDRVVVVTHRDDKQTSEVCYEYGVECIVADFNRDDAVFNKGVGINEGLKVLTRRDWMLFLDADIMLPSRPPRFHIPEMRRCLWGAARYPVISQLQLDELLAGSFHPTKPHAGASMFGAPMIMGYFQLWCARERPEAAYPETYMDASQSDLFFNMHFAKEQRCYIPLLDYHVFHLEMPGDKPAANWRGRTTPKFDYAHPPENKS